MEAKSYPLTKEAAAVYLGMSLSTLNRLIKNGAIEPKRIGPKKLLFEREVLDNYLITNQTDRTLINQ